MTIDPQEFGEVKANTQACKEGIGRIESAIKDHVNNYRENVRTLHVKADKAHDRIDDLDKDFSSSKAKLAGFAAAIAALWSIIIHFVKGNS